MRVSNMEKIDIDRWDLFEVNVDGERYITLVQQDKYSQFQVGFDIKDFCNWVDWLVEKRQQIVSQGNLAN